VQYLYGFNATPSGLTTNDPTDSYDAIYEVEAKPFIGPPVLVPAVSPLGLVSGAAGLLAIGLAGLRRRRQG
jgi:MYXO-CTERM domain-containing protein